MRGELAMNVSCESARGNRGGGHGTGKIHLADGASQSEVTRRLDFSPRHRITFQARESLFLHYLRHTSEE